MVGHGYKHGKIETLTDRSKKIEINNVFVEPQHFLRFVQNPKGKTSRPFRMEVKSIGQVDHQTYIGVKRIRPWTTYNRRIHKTRDPVNVVLLKSHKRQQIVVAYIGIASRTTLKVTRPEQLTSTLTPRLLIYSDTHASE